MTVQNDGWLVTMRGSLGYTCLVGVSAGNAENEAEAISIAGRMFPELVVQSATMVREFIEDHPRDVPP